MKKLIILCGPSASGKNTILDILFNDNEYSFKRVVTNTTRPKRPDDKEGEIYHFLSREDFEKKLNEGYFYEHENVHGYLYGTGKNSFEQDGIFLMQIDIKGALSLKKFFNNSLIIFINIPREQQIKRLQERGSSPEEIETRLNTSDSERKMINQADLVVDNFDGQLHNAVEEVKKAIDNFLKVS